MINKYRIINKIMKILKKNCLNKFWNKALTQINQIKIKIQTK
jgi:hypothetical protein